MERRGRMDERRENGLHHAPTTPSRRISPMRVTLQRVVVSRHSAENRAGLLPIRLCGVKPTVISPHIGFADPRPALHACARACLPCSVP